MEDVNLIQVSINPLDGKIIGVDKDGSLWWYREIEIKKSWENDGFAGEVGDLIYPIGWYPYEMRKLVSNEHYWNAGVKKS
jgi:hypothetical protein